MALALGFVIFLASLLAPPMARDWSRWTVVLMLLVGANYLLWRLAAAAQGFMGGVMEYIILIACLWLGGWGMAVQAVILHTDPVEPWKLRLTGLGLMAGFGALIIFSI